METHLLHVVNCISYNSTTDKLPNETLGHNHFSLQKNCQKLMAKKIYTIGKKWTNLLYGNYNVPLQVSLKRSHNLLYAHEMKCQRLQTHTYHFKNMSTYNFHIFSIRQYVSAYHIFH